MGDPSRQGRVTADTTIDGKGLSFSGRTGPCPTASALGCPLSPDQWQYADICSPSASVSIWDSTDYNQGMQPIFRVAE